MRVLYGRFRLLLVSGVIVLYAILYAAGTNDDGDTADGAFSATC